MNIRILSDYQLDNFKRHLINQEKSTATVDKYLRDVRAFFRFINNEYFSKDINDVITKDRVIAYKKALEEKGYAIRSINSMLSSLNCFLKFTNKSECAVKFIRTQKEIYCPEEKELTKAEYLRLLEAAKGKQIKLIMQTICGTGIRVSELKHFTVEAIKKGKVVVHCKSKIRTIFIPGKLRKLLLDFAKKKKIKSGMIFVTKNGKAMDRSNIWAQMKHLCKKAGVKATKVFPHNLRKLFAKTFYKIDKDIAKLADILGHGSIDTTRIYIMTTGAEHKKKIERLGLII